MKNLLKYAEPKENAYFNFFCSCWPMSLFQENLQFKCFAQGFRTWHWFLYGYYSGIKRIPSQMSVENVLLTEWLILLVQLLSF